MIQDDRCSCFTDLFAISLSHVSSVGTPILEADLPTWPGLDSLVLQIDIRSEAIRSAIDILHRCRSTRIRAVTVDLTSRFNISGLLQQCDCSSIIKLLSELENELCGYQIHHTTCSLGTCYALHVRKWISWGEQYRKSYRAHQQSLLPPIIDFRYSKSS